MTLSKKILVIIPAFNEAATIQQVIEKTRQGLPMADVAVVNDGSSDATSALARQAGARVLDLPFNLGIGGAMQTGYKFAYRMGYDIAVQCDGDGQHHPSQIKKLIDTLLEENADMVIGSRYLDKDRKRFRSSPFRRLGMVIFSNVLSLIVGQKLTDTTSGFRAVNREVIRSFAISYPTDYPEPEALVLLHREGFSIKEVYVNMSARKGGNSSISGIKPVYYMIKVLLAIFIDLCKNIPYKKENKIC